MQFPYGNWQPDRGGPGTGLSVCEGVIRTADGYGPYPQLVAAEAAEALPGTPRGIVSVQATDGNWYVFAGTETTIEKMASDYTWDSIDTGRTLISGADVSFAMFGEYLVNTDVDSGMRAYNVVTPAGNNAVTAGPAAVFIFGCGNTLFALGTPTEPRRFGNSDFRNHTKWSGGVANGNTLEDGGALVGGADQNNGFGIMFQERAIRGIQWSGSQYALPKIADGLGCVHGRTIASFNGKVAFWNDDGPWLIDGQSAPVPIGAEKISRWAKDTLGRENFQNLQGTVDPQRKLFMWRLDESRVLTWCWLGGQTEFTILPVSTTALARIATPAVSVDALTGTVDALEGSIDELSGSSAPQMGGLNLSRKYATFAGQNMAITLETTAANALLTGLIGGATPVDNFADGTLQVGVSDRLDATLSWKSGASKVSDGSVMLRARGHNIAFRRNVPAGATGSYLTGIDHLRVAQGGRR